MNGSDTSTAFADLFAPEPDPVPGPVAAGRAPWKVLLVDDDPGIHAVLRLALQDAVVQGAALHLMDASGNQEAQALLADHADIAMVFLDVVMETHDAGLQLVQHIRQHLGNRMMRIVLLTGQPGYSPQRAVVEHYEIDSYLLKLDLNADKLYMLVYAGLRTFETLQHLAQTRAVEQLARDLQQANAQLSLEIAERQRAQENAELQLNQLRLLNERLEQAQSQLLQSEKLASIGLLASGVAHEINNPIGFVNANLASLKRYTESLVAIIDAFEAAELNSAGNPMERFEAVDRLKVTLELAYVEEDLKLLLQESQEGLDRIKKIVQSLKDFSRIESSDTWREDDILLGLESTLNVVWNELKYKCEVRKDYSDLPPVQCVMSQLNQVFMNLLVNAAQAIEVQGVITLRALQQGDEVWLEIADTGCGIAPEHLAHVFDPFFTTKPVGMGTGLGLSISHGIVQRHHGRLEVHSELGKGTIFRICLPIRQPAIEQRLRAANPA
jgi:signal transduction histidine kinase